MSLILRRPNKLAFPGTMPGFDPTHVAFSNGGAADLFWVCQGKGNFARLDTYKTGVTTVGAPVYNINSLIGPCIATSASGNYIKYAAQTEASPTAAVFAAIFSTSDPTQSFEAIFYGSDASFSNALYISSSVINCYIGGSNTFSQTISANTPYFVAVSIIPGSTSYCIVKNLRTGSASVSSLTSAGTMTAPSLAGFGWRITEDNSGDIFPSSGANGIAAVARIANAFLTPAKLLAWADDPWSFWYPQRIDLAEMLNVAPALGLPAAGLLQTRSRPGLGPQSRHTALLNAALPTPVAVVTVTGGTLPIMGVG